VWSNLLFKQADQHVSPRAFEILGVGIHKHKTNSTGKVEWTGITRHAKADQDAFAALADLLAHEIAIQTFRLINMLDSADPQDGAESSFQRVIKLSNNECNN